MRARTFGAALLLVSSILGCGGSDETTEESSTPTAVRRHGRGHAAEAPPAPAAGALCRRPFKDEDFEPGESNRDPFENQLAAFMPNEPKIGGPTCLLEKFALEELSLIAIVSGGANPLAMFRDPSGTGFVVRRGDCISKIGARVVKILSDGVVFELREETGGPQPRMVLKEVALNPAKAEGR